MCVVLTIRIMTIYKFYFSLIIGNINNNCKTLIINSPYK